GSGRRVVVQLERRPFDLDALRVPHDAGEPLLARRQPEVVDRPRTQRAGFRARLAYGSRRRGLIARLGRGGIRRPDRDPRWRRRVRRPLAHWRVRTVHDVALVRIRWLLEDQERGGPAAE